MQSLWWLWLSLSNEEIANLVTKHLKTLQRDNLILPGTLRIIVEIHQVKYRVIWKDQSDRVN